MKRPSGIREPKLHQPLLGQIAGALAAADEPMTAGAISFSVGHGARGALGSDPAPEVAAALAALVGAETVVRLAACPVCRLPGEVYLPSGRAARPDENPARDGGEPGEPAGPPTDEGVEIGERPELIEGGCCRRVARPWRRVPRAV